MTEYCFKEKLYDILYTIDFACSQPNSCVHCPFSAKPYDECRNWLRANALYKQMPNLISCYSELLMEQMSVSIDRD